MSLAGESQDRQELGLETGCPNPSSIVPSGIAVPGEQQQVTEAEQAVAPAPRLASAEGRSLNILLVDDVLANRKLVDAYLKSTPHQVDIAENGEIAVRKFLSGTYDLVFMDMQMPVMDGFAATKAIRQWQHGNGKNPTPILALTAYVLEAEVKKCLAAGCTAHLGKPIRKATLLDAIHEYA